MAVLAAAFVGCGDEDPTGPVATTSVSIQDNSFSPSAIVVAPGADVTWTWTGSDTHTVNFAAVSITDGPAQATGTHTTAMPMTLGTYTYVCDFHAGMAGSVLVQ